MKRIIFLTAVLFVAVSSFAQNGIKWETGTFNEALNKAKNNKKGPKIVFMDCYTSWCGPCKHMANVVFQTKEAGDYFNKNFVNFKQDMEKGEGVSLAKKFAISAYPTFLILDFNGNEIGRVVGGGEIDEFIKLVETAKDPSKSLDALLKKYEESNKISDAYEYLNVCANNNMKGNIEAFILNNYDKLGNNKFNKNMWKYIGTSISISKTDLLDKIIDEKYTYDAVLGKGEVDKYICYAIKNGLYRYLMGVNSLSEANVNKACNIIKLLSSGNRFEEFIVKAAKVYSSKDIDAIIKLFDARNMAYSFSTSEMNDIEKIFMRMREVPQVEKVRFLRERKADMDAIKKSVDNNCERCKDFEVPERQDSSVPAVRM